MLIEIQIKNLALIKDITVPFTDDLNVITGKTGAGKSILLQAIELILGSRPRPHSIREGEDKLEVNALLSTSGLSEAEINNLPEQFRPKDGESEISISRIISRTGPAKSYINGKVASVSLLTQVVKPLIDICGQSQHVKLSDVSFHLSIIDSFAEINNYKIGKALTSYKTAFKSWNDIKQRYKVAKEKEDSLTSRKIELEDRIDELKRVSLGEGKRSFLEDKIKKLGSAEQLATIYADAEQKFSTNGGLLEIVESLKKDIASLSDVDAANGEKLNSIFKDISTSVDEFDRELSLQASKIEIEDDILEDLREELSLLARIERKYRMTDAELLEFYDKSVKELDEIETGFNIEQLKSDLDASALKLEELAENLSEIRKKAGDKLAKLVAEELSQLDMKSASIGVSMTKVSPSKNGWDSVELMFSSNKGVKLLPLRKVASGGELSRLTLVLKNILASKAGTTVLVFDEVDTGISGSVARAVGSKLKRLSMSSQVICITHLPQVASLAANHILVEKNSNSVSKLKEVATFSKATILDREGKINEVARLLSGFKVTKAARASAVELLDSAFEDMAFDKYESSNVTDKEKSMKNVSL